MLGMNCIKLEESMHEMIILLQHSYEILILRLIAT